MLYISSLGENNCYDVKLVKFTKWQLSSLKMALGCHIEWNYLAIISWIHFASQTIISILAWDKSRDSGANSPKLEDM